VTNSVDAYCIHDDDDNDYSQTIQQICMSGADQVYRIWCLYIQMSCQISSVKKFRTKYRRSNASFGFL